jgi:hypothetical protein
MRPEGKVGSGRGQRHGLQCHSPTIRNRGGKRSCVTCELLVATQEQLADLVTQVCAFEKRQEAIGGRKIGGGPQFLYIVCRQSAHRIIKVTDKTLSGGIDQGKGACERVKL